MPGPIDTPLLRDALAADPAIAARVEANNPLPPHVSSAESVANAVLFLASDESATMCGAEVVVDCGHTNNPLQPHVSSAESVANVVLFLASDESATMCGAEVVVDCGHTVI